MARDAARLLTVLFVVAGLAGPSAQGSVRRLTTVEALHQFPGYFHLQNVLLRGEFVEGAGGIAFRADTRDIRAVLAEGVTPGQGPVEARGYLVDIGRLEPGDPRLVGLIGDRDAERWPRPGEELVLRVTGVIAADTASGDSIRSLALEPWKFAGQTVSVVGQFRGRNLLGDLPASPARGPYDFVVRAADGAVWVTGLRPRGRGFELAVDARVDTARWIRVTGALSHERGLVMIAGVSIAEAEALSAPTPADEPDEPKVPVLPLEVVFNSPTEGEINVPATVRVRVQLSRGANAASLEGRIRASYLGADPAAPGLGFRQRYDAATRAVELTFAQPLEPLRTVKVDLLEGITAFDGAPLAPWSLTFSVGG